MEDLYKEAKRMNADIVICNFYKEVADKQKAKPLAKTVWRLLLLYKGDALKTKCQTPLVLD